MGARVNEGAAGAAMAPDPESVGAATAPDPADLVGAVTATAPDPGATAVMPPTPAHGEPASNGVPSSEGEQPQPAEGGGGSGRAAASQHVCSMYGGPPSVSFSGDGTTLKACGSCRSVRY